MPPPTATSHRPHYSAKELDDLVEELTLDAPSDAKPEKKSSGAKKVKKKVSPNKLLATR